MHKNLTIAVFILLLLACVAGGCSSTDLSEDRARKTVDALLARGAELPYNFAQKPATIVEWRGLIKVSETETHAKALIDHYYGQMAGQFIFHKTSENEWILDKVDFTRPNKFSWWRQDVFQKVE